MIVKHEEYEFMTRPSELFLNFELFKKSMVFVGIILPPMIEFTVRLDYERYLDSALQDVLFEDHSSLKNIAKKTIIPTGKMLAVTSYAGLKP